MISFLSIFILFFTRIEKINTPIFSSIIVAIILCSQFIEIQLGLTTFVDKKGYSSMDLIFPISIALLSFISIYSDKPLHKLALPLLFFYLSLKYILFIDLHTFTFVYWFFYVLATKRGEQTEIYLLPILCFSINLILKFGLVNVSGLESLPYFSNELVFYKILAPIFSSVVLILIYQLAKVIMKYLKLGEPYDLGHAFVMVILLMNYKKDLVDSFLSIEDILLFSSLILISLPWIKSWEKIGVLGILIGLNMKEHAYSLIFLALISLFHPKLVIKFWKNWKSGGGLYPAFALLLGTGVMALGLLTLKSMAFTLMTVIWSLLLFSFSYFLKFKTREVKV